MFGIDAQGVYPIAPTPFTDTGAVDTASTDRMVDWYREIGATGMTILGIMGEAPKLDQSEAIATRPGSIATIRSGPRPWRSRSIRVPSRPTRSNSPSIPPTSVARDSGKLKSDEGRNGRLAVALTDQSFGSIVTSSRASRSAT